MATPRTTIYGLMAEFEDPNALVAAAYRAQFEGYRRMDAYSPFPIEEFVVRRAELASWTALADGEPVGHVAVLAAGDELFTPHWERAHGLPAERLGVLSTLFVDPTLRGARLGRRLHDVAVGWMREQVLGPCLDVVPVHTGALRLYESTGWVEVVRLRPPWLPAGQPDVIGMAPT